MGEVQEHPISAESLVLHDEGYIIDAVFLWYVQSLRYRIIQNKHPGKATVHLNGSGPQPVWMVPYGRGGLINPEADMPFAIRRYHLMGAAIHLTGNEHPVPVYRSVLPERISNPNPHNLPPLCADGRSEQ